MLEGLIIETVCDGDISTKVKLNSRVIWTVENMIECRKEADRFTKSIVGGSRENPKRRYE